MIDLTRSEQTYLRNSAIIETRLYDAHGGVLRIVDFAPRFRSRGRVFRPMMFVRSVEPLAGRPTLRLRLRPTAGFGERCEPGITGSHHIRFAADGLHYRVTTDASLAALLENRPVVLEQPLHFIIGPDETLQESPAALAREFLGATLTLLAGVGAHARGAGGLAGRGDPRGHHAQAVHLRGHRRGAGGADDLHSRGARTARATGTIAIAGCATATSSCRR